MNQNKQVSEMKYTPQEFRLLLADLVPVLFSKLNKLASGSDVAKILQSTDEYFKDSKHFKSSTQEFVISIQPAYYLMPGSPNLVSITLYEGTTQIAKTLFTSKDGVVYSDSDTGKLINRLMSATSSTIFYYPDDVLFNGPKTILPPEEMGDSFTVNPLPFNTTTSLPYPNLVPKVAEEMTWIRVPKDLLELLGEIATENSYPETAAKVTQLLNK